MIIDLGACLDRDYLTLRPDDIEEQIAQLQEARDEAEGAGAALDPIERDELAGLLSFRADVRRVMSDDNIGLATIVPDEYFVGYLKVREYEGADIDPDGGIGRFVDWTAYAEAVKKEEFTAVKTVDGGAYWVC